MKTAYFDCFSGISGDMILGALIDAGLPLERLAKALSGLGVKGYRLEAKKVKKNGLIGTKFDVIIDKELEKRGYTDLVKLIEKSKLSKGVKGKSLQILSCLGTAESKVHDVPLSKLHFHELGSIDTIVDIVGTVLALELLEIEKIFSSPLPMGKGMVKTAHGLLPIPAPATLNILKGVPVDFTKGQGEMVTPTGAAIIKTLADGFGVCPEITPKKTGYGAGSRNNPDTPNMLRVTIGESSISNLGEDKITVIETNIDDMNPQILGYVMEKLFLKGAMDVFFMPVYAKKNRPGILLTVLSEKDKVDEMIRIILKETTSFGVRFYETKRKILKREFKKVKTKYGEVSVKLGYLDGKVIKAQPEYEDCKKIAQEKNIPLIKILKEI